MKIVTLIARLLLGLMFPGLRFQHVPAFSSMGPMPAGLAGQFTAALFAPRTTST